MRKMSISRLRRNVMLYITIIIIVLTIITVLIVAVSVQKHHENHTQEEATRQISLDIESTVPAHLKEYTYRMNQIMITSEMARMLKQKDREGLYAKLKPVWELLKKDEPNLTIMHIHLADGTSFLRLHKPEFFGDQLMNIRPMMKEIHTTHKMIIGYETGKLSTVYRIIMPIFDENKNYIGAFELGINPKFILEAIRKRKHFYGMMFIKDDDLKLFSRPSDVLIDGYRLQSNLNLLTSDIVKKLNHLENGMKIFVGDKIYKTYLFVLNSYKNQPRVKIMFFQDISKTSFLSEGILVGLLIFMFFSIVLIIWLIYRRIGLYENTVDEIYNAQMLELEESKQLLLKSQQYFQTLFNVLPNIMITTDGEDIETANQAMLEFFNYKTIEDFKIEHKCVCEYFLNDKDCIVATMDGDTWLKYILQRDTEVHKVHMIKDGKKEYFLVSAKALHFDETLNSIVIFTNVTELETIKERYEYAIGGSRDGLWDWNLETDDLYFSPRWKEQLGYSDDELSNEFLTWEQRVHPDDLEIAKNAIKIAQTEQNIEYSIVYRLLHKNNYWVWILDRGQTIFNENGKAVRMVGFHTDISDIKKLEKEIADKAEMMLAQSRQAAMGEMISMIAHQWRQPISAIAMGANNILADIELEILDNETLKDGAISILNQTQELSKTIDDFRNFFKPSKTLEEVLIKDIFTEAYEIIGSSFKNNNVEVITEIENRLKIKTYPRELMQVLLNILKNAKEALADNEVPQKRIYVSMKDELSNAVIKICDNAKGIKEELLQRIFEPYFSTKDEKNGTGLGLYMSKTIIEKHLQGSLKVYNKDDGVCFEIKLPYVMQEKIE